MTIYDKKLRRLKRRKDNQVDELAMRKIKRKRK